MTKMILFYMEGKEIKFSVEQLKLFNEILYESPHCNLLCNCCLLIIHLSEYNKNLLNIKDVRISYVQCAKCNLFICDNCQNNQCIRSKCQEGFKILSLKYFNEKCYKNNDKFDCPFCGKYKIVNDIIIAI